MLRGGKIYEATKIVNFHKIWLSVENCVNFWQRPFCESYNFHMWGQNENQEDALKKIISVNIMQSSELELEIGCLLNKLETRGNFHLLMIALAYTLNKHEDFTAA